ncbi:MAG: SH3 domain-containing protein [Pseudomonadota bacterium]
MRFLFIVLLLLPSLCLSQESTGNFVDGVNAYEAKDYDSAKNIFLSLLEQSPENPTLLYNRGLVEFQLGQFGLALGLWRKARFLSPGSSEIQAAIAFTEEMLFPETPETSFLGTLYKALSRAPLHLWIFLSFLSLFPALWYAVIYGIKEKRPFPSWPLWISLSIPIFILSATMTTLMNMDRMKMRATVISKNQLTHTNPSDTSPTLSELNEGQIVFVEKTHESWVQVRTPTGAPGWVPKQSLISFGETP